MSMNNRDRKTVLVFGIGKLGGPLVDVLAMRHSNCRFILVSRDKERSQKRANLARYLAAQWGLYPEIICDETDIYDINRTADLLDTYRPDIVFNATTPFPWWKIDHLPPKEKLLAHEAGPGVWCALDCLLPVRLTEALSLSKREVIHINACYPDMTNAFLSSHKFGPKLGIGNISNLVPGLHLSFAEELGISPQDVKVQITGHHYVSWNAPSTKGCPDAPYDLTVSHPKGSLHFRGPDDTPFAILRKNASRVRGLEGLGVTIGSAATLVSAFLGGIQREHHSPGAKGLPGGYPIIIDSDGEMKLNLPEYLSEKDAVAINEKAQMLDGIACVKADSVEATAKAKEAHKQIIGTDLSAINYSNVLDVGLDTLARLEKRFSLNLNIR